MSIDMYLDQSNNQANDVSNTVKTIKNNFENLQKEIMQFIEETELKGKAYDSGKQFFSTVIIPLIESMKTLGDLTDLACKEFVDKYQSEVDSQSLKESELEEDINELKQQITHLENMESTIKSSSSGLMPSTNKLLIVSLNHQKNELEDKLRKLRAFNQISPNIFKEIESFLSIILQGITQAETSWNDEKKEFNIPSTKQLEWTKVSQREAQNVNMKLILKKIEDGYKLNKVDLQNIIDWRTSHPKEDLHISLKEYLNENKDSILRDLRFDIVSNGLELFGLQMQRLGGELNVTYGIKGPDTKNSFVIVTNNNGNHLIRDGGSLIKVGKYAGRSFIGIGFGIGVYEDINNDDKTIGEAVSHNSLITGVSLAGASIASGLVALFSGPAILCVGVGLGVGAGLTVGTEYVYKNNFMGIKDATDWIGRNIKLEHNEYNFRT